MTFDDFFRAAYGRLNDKSFVPYDYQRRLAAESKCVSKLIEIPTGLGKTAAVVVAWLWNRVERNDASWPRRLVYCLPMRTLVEQTAGEVRKWLKNLAEASPDNERLKWLATNSPVILMGGEDANPKKAQWDIHPEHEAILIGTQDMLLSRALNRGYGMSRYRWPMHFGLLNNDALWIMDETQLMGVSVETSAQLNGFRSDEKWKPMGACLTWWMSATLDEARLMTVDHPRPEEGWPRETLSDAERGSGRPAKLFTAKKSVARCEFALSSATKGDYARRLAALIAKKHKPGTLTLVVVNRVSRAKEIFAALTIAEKKKPALYDPAHVALVHSRFRCPDRERHEKLLFGEGDRIVIATQAVEAGVDVSARLLITELAPWASLVQRIGRCNRRAEFGDAEVLWVDIEPDAKGDLLRPCDKDDLDHTRVAISKVTDASPQALGEVRVPETLLIRPVIRRRDLVDLFDTTPDLCGQDLDISRYIRDEQDSDVQFFWRAIEDDAPSPNEPPPERDELCRVSIGDAVKFFVPKRKPRLWKWNSLEEKWEDARAARPGAVYLVDMASGGYDDAIGWTGDPKDKPTPHPPPPREPDAYAQDNDSFIRHWQELAEHTAEVVTEFDKIAAALALDPALVSALHAAAQWHDVGKAHAHFQAILRDGPNQAPNAGALYAKSENPPKRSFKNSVRRGFRHELASALAWLLHAPAEAAERDLIAYIIAAHHGKVRLSIRALPDEKGPDENDERPFARGIWHDDELPAVMLPGAPAEKLKLDLSFMRMGESPRGPSWLARMIALRDHLGPFRLAFFETLLRAADMRASADAARRAPAADGTSIMREDPQASVADTSSLTSEQKELVARVVADGLAIQHKFRPEPLYKTTGQGHYEGNTVEEIRQAKKNSEEGSNEA